MEHTSYIELSRAALKNNLEYLHNTVGDSCTISHVVKGNAYGHGIDTFVPLAHELGARHFSTFDAQEALEVNEVTNGETSIMIMGMITNDQLEWAVEQEIQFFVFEMDRLRKAVTAAQKTGKKARVHIELETGMNRTGFEKDTWHDLLTYLKQNLEFLELSGFCTHYAGAENIANFIRVKDQYRRFKDGLRFMKKGGLEANRIHSACSAATIRFPKSRMDMVRIGILQYGFWPSMETYITTVQPTNMEHEDPLHRVISWKSSVMSVKNVKQGDYVGYGTSYLATSDLKIASVPVGYSHGFSRSLSNQGRVLVRGTRVSVIGIVNMNVMMLDVTELHNIEKGDEVVLIGKQGDMNISVSSFSDYSDQLNYELLTRLPHDIPRFIVP
ncbi:MAG: alanine racemase [Owenweeksia sp.]